MPLDQRQGKLRDTWRGQHAKLQWAPKVHRWELLLRSQHRRAHYATHQRHVYRHFAERPPWDEPTKTYQRIRVIWVRFSAGWRLSGLADWMQYEPLPRHSLCVYEADAAADDERSFQDLCGPSFCPQDCPWRYKGKQLRADLQGKFRCPGATYQQTKTVPPRPLLPDPYLKAIYW